MGSYSGGDYSSDDDDSQEDGSTDDHSQSGLDEYSGDDGGDDSEEESGSGVGSAAVGAAGTAGAAAGAGTASGGAGGGAGVGTGAGTGTESQEGDDPEDTDEYGDGENEDEEHPESPDIEEPDIEPEDDVDEPETEEDTEEEAADEDEDEDEEEDEDEDEEEDEDEDEEEDETVVVVQEVDALSAMSWGVQPVMKRVKERYGEDIELFYKPAPVREVDPEQEKQKWIDAGQQFGMPVDPSFWDDNPPESTELVNKAFEAAIQQYRGTDYIRALWRHGVVAGRDINDEDVLIDLASEIGLDRKRFEKDLDDLELETGERGELPFTLMKIQGKPVPKNGRVRYSDFKPQFTFQGIEEQKAQELQGFVEEYGPVATPEVMEVYEVQREDAVQRLQDLNSVSSFEVNGEKFWSV